MPNLLQRIWLNHLIWKCERSHKKWLKAESRSRNEKRRSELKMDFIGISEDRLHHIIGVARKAYKIAKEEGNDENFCRKMFMLGWIHDVGYEFSLTQEEHAAIPSELLYQLYAYNCKDIYGADVSIKTNYAMCYHGRCPDESLKYNKEWRILTTADMLVDGKGKEVSAFDRLEDIKERYGENSEQYLIAHDTCQIIGLIN